MRLAPLLLAALVVLSSLALIPAVAQAAADPVEYPYKTVQASSFDMTDFCWYGNWTSASYKGYPTDTPQLSLSYDIYDRTEGNASRDITLSWTNSRKVWAVYTLTIPATVPAIRHYTVQFDYKVEVIGTAANVHADLWRDNYISTPLNLVYSSTQASLLDLNVGKWNTWTGPLYNPGTASNPNGTLYDLKFHFGMDNGASTSTGAIKVHIDNLRFIAPESKVRFSYYNAYTGLGLQSDLLIPEVWHDGTWSRVWNNEYAIAAGEQVAYRVTDYFGQVIAHSPAFYLNQTAVYVDLPVKLVKVHISKPAWYTSDLPPTWWLTYSATGKEIPVEGWDLELISGFYSFRWDTMTVDKGDDPLDDQDDIVVREGSIGQYIDGNLGTGQSFTVSDFYLAMKPTYRSEAESNITVIPAGFLTWEGLAKLSGEIVNEISGNTLYKSIMIVLGIGGAVTFVSTYYNIGRKKAAQKLREEGK